MAMIPGGARGESGTAVVGFGECADAYGLLAQHVRRLTEETRRHAGTAVLGSDEAARRFGFHPPVDLETVALDLETGHTEYILFRLAESEKILRRAIDSLRGAPYTPHRQRTYLDANAWIAMGRHAADRGSDADAVLARMLALAPDYDLERRMFPPTFRERFDRMRASTAARQGGYPLLRVESPGAQSAAYVDGCAIGATPASVRLPEGEYDVAVASGGRPSGVHRVSLRGRGTQVSVDAKTETSFQPAGPCVAISEDRRAFVGAAERLAVLGELKQVVGVRVEKAPTGALLLSATLIGREGGRVVREGRVRIGPQGATLEDLEALAAFVMTGREQVRVIAAVPERAERTELPTAAPMAQAPELAATREATASNSEAATPGRMTPLRWVALGAGVATLASAGGGAYFWSQSGQAHADFIVLRDPSCDCYPPEKAAFVRERMDAESAYQAKSNAFLIGGGAFLAAGAGVLAYDLWKGPRASKTEETLSLVPFPGGAMVWMEWP